MGKKICAISTIHKSLEWFMMEPMINLSKEGYEITFLSNMDEEFIKKYSSFAKCINVNMHRGAKPFELLKSIRTFKKIFKKEKFDLIYYMTPNASFYASIAGKKAKIPHRVYCQYGIRYVAFSGFKRSVFKWIEKKTCKNATTIRSASPLNRELAISEKLCKPDKIKVLGIGGTTGVDLNVCDSINIDLEKQSFYENHNIPNGSFVFGYVGRLNKDKGGNELIEAFIKLKNKYPSIYLVHVGMDDDTNPISKENYKILKEDSHIIQTGNVDEKEVYKLMAAFDILVHPTYREGFGKTMQEAMAMYLPVITTDVIGAKEVIVNGETGVLIPPKNVDELVSAMEKLMNNKELRVMMGKKGRIRVETYFERTKMVKNITDDLKLVLANNV